MKKLFENWNKYLNEQNNEQNILDILADHPNQQDIVNAAKDVLLVRALHSQERRVPDAYRNLPDDLKYLADKLIDFNRSQLGSDVGKQQLPPEVEEPASDTEMEF